MNRDYECPPQQEAGIARAVVRRAMEDPSPYVARSVSGKRSALVLAATIVAAFAAIAAGCDLGRNDEERRTETETVTVTAPPPRAMTPLRRDDFAAARPLDDPLRVRAGKAKGTIYFVRHGRLIAVRRTLRGGATASSLLNALFAGPAANERAVGIGTALPRQLTLRRATIRNRVATIDLRRKTRRRAGLASIAPAQIVYTLTDAFRLFYVTVRIGGLVPAIDGRSAPPYRARHLTRPAFGAHEPNRLALAIYLVSRNRLSKITRIVPRTRAVAAAAVRELLGGVQPRERRAGLRTAIPRGTRVDAIAFSGGVLRVDLMLPSARTKRRDVRLVAAQVVYTLTEFPTVRTVELPVNRQSVRDR